MDIDVRFNECTRYFGEEGIEGFGGEGFRAVGRGELSEGGAELPAQFGEDHFNEVVCCSNGITYGYMIMEAAATAVMVHAVCVCVGFGVCGADVRQTKAILCLHVVSIWREGFQCIPRGRTTMLNTVQKSIVDWPSRRRRHRHRRILLVKISMMRLLVINHRIYFACSPSHLILIILQ